MFHLTRPIQVFAPLAAFALLAPLAVAQDAPPMPAADASAVPVAPVPSPDGSREEFMAKIQADQERARALVESTTSMQTGPVPHAYPLERYSLLWERSPFDMEVTPPETVEKVDPFKDYALLGVMSAGGFQSASFFNKAENKSIYVSTEENSKKPFRVVSIEPGKDLASTIVRVSGSGQEGIIAYDPEVSKQRRSAGGGGGGQGGAPPPMPTPTAPAGAPTRSDAGVPNRGNRGNPSPGGGNATANNGARPNMPRPAGTNPAANPGNNQQGAQGSGERRPRRRVIIPRQVPAQR